MTQIVLHFIRDPSLAQRCRGNKEECDKMVRETLRFLPPAPTARGLRWDTM